MSWYERGSDGGPVLGVPVAGDPARGESAEHEYRALTLPRGTTREAARQMLAIHAEFGEWELTRHRIWPDGRRKVWMRRRRRPGELPLPSHY